MDQRALCFCCKAYSIYDPLNVFISGCLKNKDLENEDQRLKIPQTKTQNLKTASKSKEITCFSSYNSLVAFLNK